MRIVQSASAEEAEKLEKAIRAHVAFEHLIVSVLASAAISGAGSFLIHNGAALIGGGWSPTVLLETSLGALLFAFLVFLIGFGASIAIGAPLFALLERLRYRRIWPFFAAAIALQYAALAVALGGVPMLDHPARLLFFMPGLIAIGIFWRRIAPVWRGAEHTPAASAVVRLH